MIDFSSARVQIVASSWVGNKNRYEGYRVPANPIAQSNDVLEELLTGAFSRTFRKTPEFWALGDKDTGDNDVRTLLTGILDGGIGDAFVAETAISDLTSILYEHCDESRIHGGDFLMVQFVDLMCQGVPCSAVGLWKTEGKTPFLQTDNRATSSVVIQVEGIETDKMEVAGLFLYMEGHVTCVAVDKVSKRGEWSFWKDGFLRLVPEVDNFYQTKWTMSLTSEFIKDKMTLGTESTGLTRPERLHILVKALDYFKDAGDFDQTAFQNTVLPSEAHEAFGEFCDNFKSAYGLHLETEFTIDPDAVKQFTGLFKTSIKLDDRFTVTAKSRWDMVKFGKEEDGRKFYKIYFDYES